jgi:NAD(P)-dependent dehydrogenase (short-subunit alcohol dehydrogenase family)
MNPVASQPVAFVTGTGSGLGLEITRTLLDRGYRVAMFSRFPAPPEAGWDTLEQQDRVLALAGDVADAESVSRAVAAAMTRWGRIDLAIANAGLRDPGRLDRLALESTKRTMEVNYFGMLHLFDACVPGMIERRSGSFVGIASLAGIRCLPGGAAYGASKAAMQAFLDTARTELRPLGVRVTIVNPWFIHTPNSPPVSSRPFSVAVDWAARRIVDGVARGQSRIEFPYAVSLLWGVVRVLPNWLFDALFAHRDGRTGLGQRAMSLLGRAPRRAPAANPTRDE